MGVTIEQIAGHLGVSPGTVSRALNGKNKENRPSMIRRSQEIRQLASNLGYRPNLAARQMVRGRFDLISFLNCGAQGFDWFPRPLLHGIHDGVAAFGSRLAITEIARNQFAEPNYVPDVLSESMVDGAIVHLGMNPIPAASLMFENHPLPATYVNHKAKFNAVYPDELQGGEMAAQALIDAGHREIGFVTLNPPNHDGAHFSEIERVEGFRGAMRRHRLPDDRICTRGGGDDTNMIPYMLDYLDQYPQLTAVIAYKLEVAIALREAARIRSRLNRLSMLVFNDIPFQSSTGVPMPTLVIPFRSIGLASAEMVQQLISKSTELIPSLALPYTELTMHELIAPPQHDPT